jgi:KUP system potassium uptake protein
VAAGIFTLMATWKTGRGLIRDRLQAGQLPYRMFIDDVRQNPIVRVPGTAIFLSGNPDGTPIALLHNIRHNKVLHERVVILTIVTDEAPHVDPVGRVEVEEVEPGFFRVIGHFGFMQDPTVPEVLDACKAHKLEFNPMQTTYFLSRETVIPTHLPGMMIWRERLFAVMARNAQRATAFFNLPPNRVVELGVQVEV